jgi:hypothetical protein
MQIEVQIKEFIKSQNIIDLGFRVGRTPMVGESIKREAKNRTLLYRIPLLSSGLEDFTSHYPRILQDPPCLDEGLCP